MSEVVAAAASLEDYSRARAWPPDVIERVLWILAEKGGSPTKTAEVVKELGIRGKDGCELSRQTISNWKLKTFRNRYTDIRRRAVAALEEVIAQQAEDRAISMGDAQDRALKQTMAGLSLASGVEASQILRNISQSRHGEIAAAADLRGRSASHRQARGLEAIAKELAGYKAIRIVKNEELEEEVVDVQIVED